jgi:acyl dehydratase
MKLKKPPIALADLQARVGQEIGVSDWHVIDQKMVDAFADVCQDHQFIHVDPERAKETPFGGTIAHGFLTLSLLSLFSFEAVPVIAGRAVGINYGFDKVRFLNPVKTGQRVRARFVLADLKTRGEKEVQLRYAVTVEIEGEPKPAVAADWLTMAVLE